MSFRNSNLEQRTVLTGILCDPLKERDKFKKLRLFTKKFVNRISFAYLLNFN